MSKNWTTRNGKPSIRGLFVNGIWHCDCDTRLPAEKFQVKNGGKNHGRWFFTCQKPQQKRCTFFLWADDAKIREESAVLSNSRNEAAAQQGTTTRGPEAYSNVEPQTPKRSEKTQQMITPDTGKMSLSSASKHSTAKTANKGTLDLADSRFQTDSPKLKRDFSYEEFDWSSDAEEELAEIAESLDSQHTVQANNDEESPRKIAKVSEFSSPSKRSYEQMSNHQPSFSDGGSIGTWLTNEDDLLATPSTSTKSTYLMSPEITPSNIRRRLFPSEIPQKVAESPEEASTKSNQEPCSLAESVLSILSTSKALLPEETQQALIALLNKHEMQALGVSKGRDIARLAIKNKEQRIKELETQIARLEQEKEMSRNVINHLKTDIMTSPKKPRRSGETPRRSQV